MTTEIQKQQDNGIDVGRMLMDPKFKAQLAAALPRHMTPDRMARIALTECRKNPELLACDQMSFIGAIFQCAQLGLEPGNGLGHAYLVPFNNRRRGTKEVNFITGYKGLVDLARRSDKIDDVYARCVYERDEFEYVSGDNERIEHKPFRGSKKERGPVIAVYAIAKFKGGGANQREVMWKGDVDEIRDRFSHGNPVWKSDYDEMARKTVVRKLAKYLPLSPELRDAILAEEAPDGAQENWAAIDVNYQPKQFISADATTIADNNREGAETSASKRHSELAAKLLLQVERLEAGGMKLSAICGHLMLKDWPNLETITDDRLIAMTEKLKTVEATDAR